MTLCSWDPEKSGRRWGRGPMAAGGLLPCYGLWLPVSSFRHPPGESGLPRLTGKLAWLWGLGPPWLAAVESALGRLVDLGIATAGLCILCRRAWALSLAIVSLIVRLAELLLGALAELPLALGLVALDASTAPAESFSPLPGGAEAAPGA